MICQEMAPACFPSLEINDWVGSHENGRLMGRTRMPNLWIWIQAVTACTSLRRDICREGVPGTHSLCNHEDISLSLSLVDCTGMNYIRGPRFPSLLLSRGLEQARISLPCFSLFVSPWPPCSHSYFLEKDWLNTQGIPEPWFQHPHCGGGKRQESHIMQNPSFPSFMGTSSPCQTDSVLSLGGSPYFFDTTRAPSSMSWVLWGTGDAAERPRCHWRDERDIQRFWVQITYLKPLVSLGRPDTIVRYFLSLRSMAFKKKNNHSVGRKDKNFPG